MKNKKNNKKAPKNAACKKRIKWIIAVVAISALCAAFIIPKMIYRINEGLVEQDATVEDVDVSGISEKTFTGSYSSGHMYANVEVTIVNGQYTDIILTGYSGINPSRADKVIDAILRNQTLTPNEGDIGEQFTDIIVQKAIYYAVRYSYSVG